MAEVASNGSVNGLNRVAKTALPAPSHAKEMGTMQHHGSAIRE